MGISREVTFSISTILLISGSFSEIDGNQWHGLVPLCRHAVAFVDMLWAGCSSKVGSTCLCCTGVVMAMDCMGPGQGLE